MEVWLIRHGESEGNRYQVHQGWGDFPLTDKGRRQAALTREALRFVPFDLVYSSDLRRAYETARIIFPDHAIQSSDWLRETHCGALSGLTKEEAARRFGALYTANPDPFDLRPFGGEHVTDMENRLKHFMAQLESAAYRYARIAVVTHGGPLKAVTASLLGTTFTAVCDRLVFDNCGLTQLRFHDCRWQIVSLNGTIHLKSALPDPLKEAARAREGEQTS